MGTTRIDEPGHLDWLLEDLRAQRRLPPPAERQRIRETAGVSQRKLARALGVSWTAIQRWEAGSTPRDPSHIAEYRRALDALRHLDEGGDAD